MQVQDERSKDANIISVESKSEMERKLTRDVLLVGIYHYNRRYVVCQYIFFQSTLLSIINTCI